MDFIQEGFLWDMHWIECSCWAYQSIKMSQDFGYHFYETGERPESCLVTPLGNNT